MADVAVGACPRRVGGPEGKEQAPGARLAHPGRRQHLPERTLEGPPARIQAGGLGAVPPRHIAEPGRDAVQRFIPADALEPILSARAASLQGMQKPVGRIHDFRRAARSGAAHALRVALVRGHFADAISVQGDADSAARRTDAAVSVHHALLQGRLLGRDSTTGRRRGEMVSSAFPTLPPLDHHLGKSILGATSCANAYLIIAFFISSRIGPEFRLPGREGI